MNKEKEIKEGFAEDHASQRRRRVTADNKEQLEQEIRRLEERWRSELRDAGIVWHSYRKSLYTDVKNRSEEGLNSWKKEALKGVVEFPDPPRPPNRQQYHSVFLPPQFDAEAAYEVAGIFLGDNKHDKLLRSSAEVANKIHLDDYSRFYSLIQEAAQYRLAERISKARDYPVPKPELPSFPPRIRVLEQRQIHLRWYNYLQSEFLRRKNETEQYNKWLVALLNDRQLYWENRKEQFEKASRECLDQWQEGRSRWDAEIARDRARFQDLRLHYETGDSKAVVGYFLAQLDSILLPRWCPREYELQFEEDEGILLIECRLPYFGALEFVKTKELTSGSKQVPVNQREVRDLTNQFPYLVALRDERAVTDEAKRALAKRRKQAVRKIEMPQGFGKAGKKKAGAHQRSAKRHQQPRPETIESQTDQR